MLCGVDIMFDEFFWVFFSFLMMVFLLYEILELFLSEVRGVNVLVIISRLRFDLSRELYFMIFFID